MDVKQMIRHKPGKKIINMLLSRDIAVFFVFLLISFILWYLNSLRKTMETEVSFRISIEKPNSVPASGETPYTKAYIRFAGTGFALLKASLNSVVAPVKIDAGYLNKINKLSGVPAEYYILAADIRPLVEMNFSPELRLLSIRPDTLFIARVPKE